MELMSGSGGDRVDPPRMPSPLLRTRRSEAGRESFQVEIETTTPILGGAPVIRSLDTIDVIRVPTIRGHLRFWWRALYGHQYCTEAELFRKEAALWGKAADGKGGGGRSPVEISVDVPGHVRKSCRTDDDDPPPNSREGYVLWAARATAEEKKAGRKGAPRYRPSIGFRMTVSAPTGQLAAVRHATRAWILFGGYGSRTRRGLGALTVVGQKQSEWLPDDDDEAESAEHLGKSLQELFGWSVFAASGSAKIAQLPGASFLVGDLHRDRGRHHESASNAWKAAIGWLMDFRRDLSPASGARGHGSSPLVTATRLGQRAEIGLPITDSNSPPAFQIVWRQDGKHRDRLASPVIVKPLPTLLGFRPCALWLARPAPLGDLTVTGIDPEPRVLRAMNDGGMARSDFVTRLTTAPRGERSAATKISP
ncbi:MAG TPA: RAMP superfamily CRISPR-associated protein [Acetobacteraceae bacterium]|nr:RAMP superfamily CRISPR-associated protein [Acetobacteraceae bacterium]